MKHSPAGDGQLYAKDCSEASESEAGMKAGGRARRTNEREQEWKV